MAYYAENPFTNCHPNFVTIDDETGRIFQAETAGNPYRFNMEDFLNEKYKNASDKYGSETCSVAEPSSHSSSSIVPLAPVSNLEEVSHHKFKRDASHFNRWSGSRDESFGSDSSVSHELRPVMHSCVRPISPSPVRPVVKRQRIAFTGGTMDDIDARWYQDAADLSPASLPIVPEVVVSAPAMVGPTNTPRVLARYNTEEAVAMAFADQ